MSGRRWLCEYCGGVWNEALVPWETDKPECPKCGETQNLKRLGPTSGGDNCFGYDEETKPEVKYGFNED